MQSQATAETNNERRETQRPCPFCGSKPNLLKGSTLDDPMVFASDWLCECGQRANATSADWRWNGRTWEHHHGYPIGHVATERKPPNDEAHRPAVERKET